jgi:hypothetical protein
MDGGGAMMVLERERERVLLLFFLRGWAAASVAMAIEVEGW